ARRPAPPFAKLKLISVFAVVIFSGCVSRAPFVPFQADSPVAALKELTSRRERVYSFTAKVRYDLSTPSGNMPMKGDIQFTSENSWKFRFIGPLGVKLAEIIVTEGRYLLIANHSGQSEAGPLSDPIEIPELQLSIPRVSMIGEAVFPLTDIRPADGWNINLASLDQDSALWLYRTSNSGEEEVRLKLTYAPLRVFQEERLLNGETVFTRSFAYINEAVLPSSLKVDLGRTQLAVNFESLRVRTRKSHLTANPAGGDENAGG
ncbi:MAG: hypothetical protein V2A61_06330, partial [Calditrichota bacterium]